MPCAAFGMTLCPHVASSLGCCTQQGWWIALFEREAEKLQPVADAVARTPASEWDQLRLTTVMPTLALAIESLGQLHKPVVDRLKELQTLCLSSRLPGHWLRMGGPRVQVLEGLREVVACLLGCLETYRLSLSRGKEDLKLEREFALSAASLALAAGGSGLGLGLASGGFDALTLGGLGMAGGGGPLSWDTRSVPLPTQGGMASGAGTLSTVSGRGRGGARGGSRGGGGRSPLRSGGFGPRPLAPRLPQDRFLRVRELAQAWCAKNGIGGSGECYGCTIMGTTTPKGPDGYPLHRLGGCPHLLDLEAKLLGAQTVQTNSTVMEEPSRRLGELLGEPAKSFSASLLAESPVFVGNFCGFHHIKSRGIVIYHVYYC